MARKIAHFCYGNKRGDGRVFLYCTQTSKTDEKPYSLYRKILLKKNIAIVMQEQLLLDENFTTETILLYKKYFPDVILILSTWVDEDVHTLEKIGQYGCIVVQSEKPLIKGYSNINFQITNTSAGIQKAKELGAEYVLKTRTDQRIYNPSSLQLFIELDKLHPPHKDSKQKRRLLVSNLTTLKYRPYGLGDMVMFGSIDDMLIYWNTEHDTRVINLKGSYSVLELAKIRTAEVYLATEYLRKMGHSLKWTLEDSWEIYGKYFCIFDHSLLDLNWHKYNRHQEFRYHYYREAHTFELLNYSEWLALYNDAVDHRTIPEKILLVQEGTSL